MLILKGASGRELQLPFKPSRRGGGLKLLEGQSPVAAPKPELAFPIVTRKKASPGRKTVI